MKTDIHPEYQVVTVTCSCGNTFETRSTTSDLRVELCSECHPFYTGKQKLVDTGGRIDRFERRFGKRKRSQAAEAEAEAAEAQAEGAQPEAEVVEPPTEVVEPPTEAEVPEAAAEVPEAAAEVPEAAAEVPEAEIQADADSVEGASAETE